MRRARRIGSILESGSVIDGMQEVDGVDMSILYSCISLRSVFLSLIVFVEECLTRIMHMWVTECS